MKKFWMAIFATMFAAAGVFAQESAAPAQSKKSAEERAAQFTRRMTRELSLDANQQERVKALNLDRFKQMEEVRSITTLTKEESRSKLKAINETFFMSMKGILTPEQLTRFQSMQEEQREKIKKRRAGKAGN